MKPGFFNHLLLFCQFELNRSFATRKGLLALVTFAVVWYFILLYPLRIAADLMAQEHGIFDHLSLLNFIGLDSIEHSAIPEFDVFWQLALIIFPVMSITLAADQTCSDRMRGTLRFIVLRSSRDRVFFGRFAGVMLIQVLLISAAALSINRPISFCMAWYNITMNRADIRSQKRKEVVEAVTLRKEPVEVVARVYNIPLRTVFDWLARYRQGGWHALIEKNRQGRPKKITGDDMKWLYDAITMGNPLNYKLPFCLWSSNNIRALLQKERAVILSKSSICRLLGHLGLTPQKPLYKSYKQDPEKIKVYLSKTYPEVVAQAKKYHARIYFLDEAAFRSDAHRGTTWGKCGETPVIKDSGGRFGFKLISAVSARGDMHFDVIEESMNADKFINFLEKLRQDAGCPIFVIADNARYHHSKKVQAFLETQLGEIMIAFLPAYSPELNPDEQVWNHAKAEVSKYPIKSKLDMEKLILSAMLSIQQKIELVKSFFRLPDTLYTEKYAEG